MVSCLQFSDSGLFWLPPHYLICLSEYWGGGYQLTEIYFNLGSVEHAVVTDIILIITDLGL